MAFLLLTVLFITYVVHFSPAKGKILNLTLILQDAIANNLLTSDGNYGATSSLWRGEKGSIVFLCKIIV